MQVRRPLVLAASAAALLIASAAPPVTAAPLFEGGMSQQVGASTSTGDCTLTGDAAVDTDDSFVGDTLTRTSTVHQVVTRNTDDTDTTTYDGTVTSTLDLDVDGDTVRGGTFTSDVSSTLTPALGDLSACVASGSAAATGGVGFQTATDAWLRVEATKTAGGGGGILLMAQVAGPPIAVVDLERGFKSTTVRNIFLPAGTYLFEAVHRAPVSSQGGSDRMLTNAGSIEVEFALADAGTATTPATGPGRAFVALPGARDCADHTATATWTRNAAKVTKATFYAGRTKLAAVTRPKAGKTVVLGPLTDDAAARLKVVVAVRTKKGVSTAVVSRSYLACT